MRRLALILALLLSAGAAWAEEVVAGLSQARISIDTAFDGSELLIFGAVKREVAPPPGELGVIITIEGPKDRLAVRRKERRFGIWVNTDSIEIDAAPTFYAVATSGPWREIIADTEDLRHRISVPRAIRAIGFTVDNPHPFINALIRIRESNDLYQMKMGAVEVREETLFSTAIRLPANLTEGDYNARFFLTRDRRIVAQATRQIPVAKVGLERFLYRLAHEQPLVYGLMSLGIAIAAGWLASAAFRLVR